MMKRVAVPTLLAVPILLAAWALSAGPAEAQTGTTSSVLYRLGERSRFEEGCFDPCLCVTHTIERAAGTFKLTRAAGDWPFTDFKVTEVNWLVPLPAGDLRVTGSGTYRVGGEFARSHQLTLDLQVGDREVQRYDSGLVPASSAFPAIDIEVSMNNRFCHDTVFTLAAAPVPATGIARYSLSESNYLEGCFGPCDCPVATRPMVGRFGLVEILETDMRLDFAVVDARFSVQPADATSTDGFPASGHGVYGLARRAREQRMILDLTLAGRGPQRFDSGAVPWSGSLRRIDLMLPANGFACFDRVLDLHAVRMRRSAFQPSYHPLD
ncbi:MAG: hypothetical protein ACRD6R_13990 [Candidatus Polarisedimenticolia bacterium]